MNCFYIFDWVSIMFLWFSRSMLFIAKFLRTKNPGDKSKPV